MQVAGKYNPTVSLPVTQHLTSIEHDMKSRMAAYNKNKQSLQAIDRKSKCVQDSALGEMALQA